jgi:hypothetical protein
MQHDPFGMAASVAMAEAAARRNREQAGAYYAAKREEERRREEALRQSQATAENRRASTPRFHRPQSWNNHDAWHATVDNRPRGFVKCGACGEHVDDVRLCRKCGSEL